MDLFFVSHRHLALLTVDPVKAGTMRLKVPVEMKPGRLHNLLVGWLEVTMANIGRSRWEQGWRHLVTAEEDWFDVVFEAQAGSTQLEFCSSPWLAVPAAPEFAPAADDIELVDEAEGLEHDEVDEAASPDDPEDQVVSDEVEVPAEVEAPTKVAGAREVRDGRR